MFHNIFKFYSIIFSRIMIRLYLIKEIRKFQNKTILIFKIFIASIILSDVNTFIEFKDKIDFGESVQLI